LSVCLNFQSVTQKLLTSELNHYFSWLKRFWHVAGLVETY